MSTARRTVCGAFLLVLTLAAAGVRGARAEDAPSLDDRVRALLGEKDPERRTTRLMEIVGAKPDPEVLAAAIVRGWSWPSDAPKGAVDWTRQTAAGKESTVFALVPAAYDPAKAWPVLVWLHGGVGQPDDGGGASGTGFLDSFADEHGFLVLAPSSFRGVEWWTPAGVALVRGALHDLAARYHVDPQRVHVAGHSDGGSGCFHLLAHDPDPYAAFVAIMPHPVLTQMVGGPLYGANLVARPIWAVNGGVDRVYPAAVVEPLVERLRAAGLRIDWRALPEVGHDVTPFVDEADEILAFLAANPRPTSPSVVSFETDAPEREGRQAWVRILEAKADAPAAEGFDSTRLPPFRTPQPRLGITIDREYEGEGIRIQLVVAGTPAEKAGFREGDVLLTVGKTAVSGPEGVDALRTYLASLAGAVGEFRVKRGEEEVVLRATPQADALPAAGASARIEVRAAASDAGERRIDVRTRGVGAFRLDLAPPIWKPGETLRVFVNGAVRFEGVPEVDVASMLADAVREGPLAPVSYAKVVLRP